MVASVSNTVYGIIYDAHQDAGLVGMGQIPNSEQIAGSMRRLCDIINLWQTQGLKLFLLEDISVNLVTSQSSYTFKVGGDIDMTKPLRAVQGYVLNTDDNRRPLNMLSRNEWTNLSQITGNDGTISSFFIDKQADELVAHFWNPPDATEAANTAHLLMQTQATNPVNLEANISFPQEWRIALRWGLADDICTGQPQAIMDRCQTKATYYRGLLEDWDVEDASTSFAPDARIGQGTGRFK